MRGNIWRVGDVPPMMKDVVAISISFPKSILPAPRKDESAAQSVIVRLLTMLPPGKLVSADEGGLNVLAAAAGREV